MKNINWYRLLNIKTNGYLPIEEISDEEIEEKYHILERKINDKIEEITIKKGPNADTRKLQESLRIVQEAFEKLKTKQRREKYEAKYLKKKFLNMHLDSIIEKSEEGSYDKIKIEQFNKGNRAAEVKEQKVDWNLIYEDKAFLLLETNKIKFLNGYIMKDFINKYTIIFNKNEDMTAIGYDFYSKIDENKMKNKEYRVALFKGIRNAVKIDSNYIGSIERIEESYRQVLDDGERDAILQNEIIKTRKRQKERERIEEKGVEI